MNISCLKFLGVRRPLLGTFGRGGADSWHQHCQVRSTFPQVQNCLPSSVSTGTKSHDLTMPWCEHSRLFIMIPTVCFPVSSLVTHLLIRLLCQLTSLSDSWILSLSPILLSSSASFPLLVLSYPLFSALSTCSLVYAPLSCFIQLLDSYTRGL